MTVAQFEPLSDEGGIDHTPKTSHPRASSDYMTAAPFDLEVYADRYSEMLETQELEYQQSLLDPTAAPDGPGALEDVARAKALKEFEAESVACVVLEHFGINTLECSAGYLASYGATPEHLVKIGARVQACASQIIEAIQAREVPVLDQEAIEEGSRTEVQA